MTNAPAAFSVARKWKMHPMSYRKRNAYKLFFIAVPFLLYIMAFNYVPLFGWIYSFYNFKPMLGANLQHQQFVGLAKFAQIWTERQDIVRVLRNTFVMSFLNLSVTPLPVVLAILLSEVGNVKFRKFVQTATTFPNFISWVIVFGLAYSIFSTNGAYNQLIRIFGGIPPTIGLLGNKDAVWIFQLCLGLWKGLGWGAIIYVASITGIDQELYDAAKIDGANRFGCIRHVTLPGVIPTYSVLLLLNISSILSNGFDQYFVFYNSMVSDKIQVLDLYTYQTAILLGDYSFSIAIGIANTVISVSLLFLANYLAKRVRGSSLI